MITDDTRRYVAQNLRRNLVFMRGNSEFYDKELDEVECGNQAYRNIAASVEECGNFKDANYIHIVERLADLIDIPTCVMTNVGGEFDLPDYDRYPYKRCPECGAVVLNAD